MTAFIAHDIASWVGVPTALVIVGMVVLRKRGKGFGRAASKPASTPPHLGPPTSELRVKANEVRTTDPIEARHDGTRLDLWDGTEG